MVFVFRKGWHDRGMTNIDVHGAVTALGLANPIAAAKTLVVHLANNTANHELMGER
jgi:hypothetical protein